MSVIQFASVSLNDSSFIRNSQLAGDNQSQVVSLGQSKVVSVSIGQSVSASHSIAFSLIQSVSLIQFSISASVRQPILVSLHVSQ